MQPTQQNNFSDPTKKHCVKSQIKKKISAQLPPIAEEAKRFWSKLWHNSVPYKQVAEWLKPVELELENVKVQDNVEIIKQDVTIQLRKIAKWKAPELDGIERFQLKGFSRKQRLTEELNENNQSLSVLSWLVKSRTFFIENNPAKGNAVGNSAPVACLNLLWKLKTVIIPDKFYHHLKNKNLLLEEHKGGRHSSRDTKDQLLIDNDVIRNCNRRKTNLNMTWVDFRKAYDMVPHV